MSRAMDAAFVRRGERGAGKALPLWWLLLLLLLLVFFFLVAPFAQWRARVPPATSMALLRAEIEADVMAEIVSEHVASPSRNATPHLTSKRILVAFPHEKKTALESVGADVVAGRRGKEGGQVPARSRGL